MEPIPNATCCGCCWLDLIPQRKPGVERGTGEKIGRLTLIVVLRNYGIRTTFGAYDTRASSDLFYAPFLIFVSRARQCYGT